MGSKSDAFNLFQPNIEEVTWQYLPMLSLRVLACFFVGLPYLCKKNGQTVVETVARSETEKTSSLASKKLEELLDRLGIFE